MKTLRRLIRQIILEGPVKDSFDEKWYNTEVDRYDYGSVGSEPGTLHKDAFSNLMPVDTLKKKYGFDYHKLFDEKRDLKRLWNETIDANGLRSFWQGPKMKYFHSLSYYGGSTTAKDQLQQQEYDDNDIRDLSLAAFLRDYSGRRNKDEMSTWGFYVPQKIHSCPQAQLSVGVLLSGRVTIATFDDAWTESRSKASKKDIERHRQSGLPKRVMPTNSNVSNLVFEEQDIIDNQRIGECILDNWTIEAIVYDSSTRNTNHLIKRAANQLAEEYGIPVITVAELGDL